MKQIFTITSMALFVASVLPAQPGQTETASKDASPVDFARDVQPIFAERCVKCHGPEKQKNGFRLDRKADAMRGGDSGKPAIVPGKSDVSPLVRRLISADPEEVMPPKGQKLTFQQMALIKKWIDTGAPWPEDQLATKKHWAFTPPQRPGVPGVKNEKWVRNPIDAFVLARLEKENISPSPEADRRTLIRRLSFDLIGLPPASSEVEAFVQDKSSDAYDKLVERLLASPHFGERWGRHWLDRARYADSDGYEKDSIRPYAYLYRDWVIRAFNRDLPFDQFTIEQLAGDLLPGASHDQKVATGFHRQTLTNKEGGVDQEEFRCKAVVDRVDTTGSVWLGLTVGCAECHSHKYDPITQREFYQLFAFFNNASEQDIPAPQSAELAKYKEGKRRWDEEDNRLKKVLADYVKSELPDKQVTWERNFQRPETRSTNLGSSRATSADGASLPAQVDKSVPAADGNPAKAASTNAVTPDSIIAVLATPAEQREKKQKEELAKYYRDEIDAEAKKLNQKILANAKKEPKFPETKAAILAENEQPRQTHVHLRGDFLRKGDEVEPGTPGVLHSFKSRHDQNRGAHAARVSSESARLAPGPDELSDSARQRRALPDRLDLARWLFDPGNPLTSRVTVNRIWFHLFGRGLVATLDDFGTRGEKPSHPELLDWLATEFPRLGWSQKAMIKQIVTSATYRQSSRTRPDLIDRDANNILLARQNRFRLEAENVRDVFLAASGLLNPTVGGPSVRPPLPADIAAVGYANQIKWKNSEGPDQYRRGLYVFFQRTVPYPMLVTFDAPDSNVTCPRRERSNTPIQALTLLNDPVFFECAQALGRRVAAAPASDPKEKVQRAFEFCFGRAPTREELARLQQLYDAQWRVVQKNPENVAKITGVSTNVTGNVIETATLVSVARTLLNLDEFVTRE